MYYRVVNRTGKPQMFVPQFSLIDDAGKRYDDVVLPQAVKNIQAREDPRISLVGAVTVMGMIPPSTKEGIDDAVYGVAVWDTVDFKADAFKVYIRGLSDGYQIVQPPEGGKASYTPLQGHPHRLHSDPATNASPTNGRSASVTRRSEWVYYP